MNDYTEKLAEKVAELKRIADSFERAKRLDGDGKVKVYTFSFPSMYLGGTLVILARNEEDARSALWAHGLTCRVLPEQVSMTIAEITCIPQVVYENDGDY